MMRAIIIDDEPHCIEQLSRLLEKYCPAKVTVCGTFSTVSDAMEGIAHLSPDLLFLDVMLNGDSGFDLLRRLPVIQFEVIFTTAFDQFAVEAFRFSALDYLLKPIDPDELMTAVDKLNDKAARQLSAAQVSDLLRNLNKDGQHKRLAVPTMQGIDFINLSTIIRCQSERNYTILFLKDGRKITVAKTLKAFEDLLTAYDFFRVHHSHIVNLTQVKSYSKGKSGYIVMADDSTIEVASRRKDEFMRRMLQ